MGRLARSFFNKDVLNVAPDILGAEIVIKNKNNLRKFIINEVEAYRGEEDLACHASKGRTKRTEIMYQPGGHVYVYLIYGMHWMLNIVAGEINLPQALLIRGIKDCNGPGKVGKLLGIDGSFYGEDLCSSSKIWIEQNHLEDKTKIISKARINIDYSGPEWKNKPWRYILT